jgi:hypothetical protein
MHRCRSEILCLVCGRQIEDTAALIAVGVHGNEPHWSLERDEMDDLEVREGGAFCVRCAKLTKVHCPQMRKPNSGVIMVGPVADVRYDESLDKIAECPSSFRRLEHTRAPRRKSTPAPVAA